MGFSELVQELPKLIGSAVEANPFLGYVAIFATMFFENLFPPIPSEMVMPLGGFYVQQGKLALLPVVLAGLGGTGLGALPWYGFGRLINEERLEHWFERHGRWIGISGQDLRRSRIWFNRYGTALVFWGRLVPGIRTLISVPAGIELMPLAPFLLWTTAGSLIWNLVLTAAGWDLLQRRIPNRLVALGGLSAASQQALLPLGQHPAASLQPGTPGLLAGAAAAVLMLLLAAALWRLGVWGAGDAKWLTVLAAHAGPDLVLPLLLLTALSGGALAVVWSWARKPNPMPYALAIAAGQVLLMLDLSLHRWLVPAPS